MMCANVLNLCYVFVLLHGVEGWSCTSPTRNVFSKTGTDAVLKFTADLSDLNSPRPFEVKFYDGTVQCRIRYNADKTYTSDTIKDVSVTGDRNGNVTVTLEKVQQNNAGIYLMTTPGLSSRCNCLYMLGVPAKPVITIDKTPSVGDTATLTCSSTSTTSPSNHSLTMEYNWRVDIVDNPNGTKYSYSTGRKYLYMRNIGKEDVNRQLTCIAREDVSDGFISSRSDSFSFDVFYGPENMELSPSDTSYEKEEKSILSQITCKASCHPTCSFRWTKVGEVEAVSNTADLDLGSLSASKAGTYICTASRSTSVTQSINITVNVIYGPSQSSTNLSPSTQQYTKNEGQTLEDITCSADCFPTCTYTWTKTKQEQTTVSKSNVLSLASLHRDKAANYTCTAVNPGKSVSPKATKHIVVQVIYGPDVSTVNVKSPYYITEGDTNVEINCSSDCFPGCSYTWSNLTSGSIISSNNGVLSLSPVTRYVSGNYRCDSSNTVSQYSVSSMIIVNTVVKYAPYVTILLSEPNNMEDNSLTLYCNGSGVPSNYTYISLTQFVNGVEIQNPNTELIGTPKFSTIHFSSLTFQDTGTYTCTLNNGITDIYGSLNQIGAKDLLVKVKPKILKDELRFTGTTGAAIDILLPIYSYPKLEGLSITRYDGVNLLLDLDYVMDVVVTTTFHGKDVSLNGSRINMTLIDLKEEDFGSYTFTLKNALGSTNITIFMIAEGPPSPAKVFQFLSDQSIPTFLWEKNFNGGPRQSFVIQISLAGTDMWKNYTNIIETDKQYQINSSFYSASISDLQPGVYTARILAYNTEGESGTVHLKSTFEVKISAGDDPTQAPIAAIASGTASAIVIVAIVAVVLFVFKRRSKDTDGSRTKLSSRKKEVHDDDDDDDDDEDEVNTVNPMYVSADEVQSTDNTYAQPIKKKNISDANNVYAIVDKKKTNDKTENVKKKDLKKAAEGDTPDLAISMKKMKTGKKQASSEKTNETPKSSGAKKPKGNQDGLIYADLAFNNQTKGQKKLVIHGLDSMTEYVEVDFTKKADPLPESDEEDNKNKT